MHVSIVIVHYNTDKDTKECLASLAALQNRSFSYNIVIVDNGSKKPLHLPADLKNKKTMVVRSQANLGFTGGNNLGLFYAREHYNSDYFLLLNSDTLVEPQFLEKMVSLAKKDNTIGLVAPKIYFAKGYEFHHQSYKSTEKGRVFWFAGGSIDWPNLIAFHRGVDEIDRGQFDQQASCDFLTGCCLLISRAALDTVGLLDKRYFLYMEDVDYSIRTIKAGFNLRFCPQAIIWHKNAGSSGGAGSQTHVYYQTRNRLLFGFKFGLPRVQLTTARLLVQYLLSHLRLERKAAWDLISGRFGKQPLL
jgi:GT2 family glycosyltransferase